MSGGLKRTAVLFPAAFLMNLNLSLINFAVIFYLKDSIGIGPSTIGWFFAAGSAGYVAGCLLLRKIQNRIIPPVSMFISIFLIISSVSGMILAESPVSVLVFYLIFSTAPAFYWPQLMGWFSHGLDSAALGKTISRFNISWSAGVLTGPFIGGIMVEKELLLPFFADLGIMALLAVLLVLGLVFVGDMRKFPKDDGGWRR